MQKNQFDIWQHVTGFIEAASHMNFFMSIIEQVNQTHQNRPLPHGNDLHNDIIDDATSTMEFNDCDDTIQAQHIKLTGDNIVTIV